MRKYIQVWVEHKISNMDALTYHCDFPVEKGMRVLVPLRSQKVVGLVCAIIDESLVFDASKTKGVLQVLDEYPIFSEMQFALSRYVKEITMADSISVVKAMLPSLLKPTSTKLTVTTVSWVKLKENKEGLTKRQQEIVEWVKIHQPILYSEYRMFAKSLAKKLVDEGVIESFEKEKDYTIIPEQTKEPFDTLTQEQQMAKDAVVFNKERTYLLFGITGSGKTEVYMHLVDEALKHNKNAMILVPEVALTPQMIDRFTRRFSVPIIVYHSHLSDNERYHQYQQVANDQANIIIGTRSAVFLPLHDVGIIIMDEEHDLSFKQDTTPFYHARDVALYLSKINECPLVLGSATPSLESYARALKSVYQLLTLPNRINNTLASISIINMKDAIQQEGSVFLSNALKEAITLRLARKEQVIILLNRRGYLPTIQCSSCFEPAMCRFCDVMLTYHNEDKKLHCHHCGHVYNHYECPHCHNRQFMGSGLATQRLESVLKQLFPSAKVARLDYDNTKTKNAHQIILDGFTNHQQDILVGTQMVAKGLDIPNVTLVGILQADAALSYNDYHINESTYAMISQAAGRSGRHAQEGEVIIQAFDPSHYVIQSVLLQDYHMFFKTEMHYRKLAHLPPYFYLIAITIIDTNQEKGYQLAVNLKTECSLADMMCLGPVDLGKKRDRYHYRIVVKTKQLEKTREDLRLVLKTFSQSIHKISINVSPYHLE